MSEVDSGGRTEALDEGELLPPFWWSSAVLALISVSWKELCGDADRKEARGIDV